MSAPLLLVKILVPIMVNFMNVEIMDKNYLELYVKLYELLSQTKKEMNEENEGVYLIVITPEALITTLEPYDGPYAKLKDTIYRLTGINEINFVHKIQPLPISMDPRSFDYTCQLYTSPDFDTTSPNFLVKHSKKQNPWHDGALLYVYLKSQESSPKNELRLAAVSVFTYPSPNLFEERGNNFYGGRYQAARNISTYTGVIATAIIETNSGNGRTIHIFVNGKEITDYVKTLY